MPERKTEGQDYGRQDPDEESGREIAMLTNDASTRARHVA